jgi:hypothetical protein
MTPTDALTAPSAKLQELQKKLWFPGIIDKLIAKAESELREGNTFREEYLIENFYKPALQLQKNYNLPELVGFALARTLLADIVGRPNKKYLFRYTEQICETNEVRFERSSAKTDAAEALHEIIIRLAQSCALNTDGDTFGARERLRKAENQIVSVSPLFAGGAIEARNHLYEAYKRGLLNFESIGPDPDNKVDFLPEWSWPGTETKKEEKGDTESFKREMNIWIRAYGSDYLKEAQAQGHPINALYVEERAREEFPSFAVLKLNSSIKPKTRANPSPASLAALKEAKEQVSALRERYEAEICYIPDYIQIEGERYTNEFIIIENYLGSDYTLLQPLEVIKSLSSFTTRLAALIEGGAELSDAWQQLATIEENPRLRHALLEIYEKVNGNESQIFQEINNYPFIFPDFYRMMMKLVGDNYSENQKNLDQLILKALL